MARSLYVHIPFCHRLCPYCDFPKVIYREGWSLSYMKALSQEIEGRAFPPHSFETIYIGGGTPSALPLDTLQGLLSLLAPLRAPNAEWTVEINPEDASPDLFSLLREYGVTRLSFGLQSASPRLLALLGRRHTYEEAECAVDLAKETGFSDISLDLIYAIPGETMEELKEDLSSFLALKTPHLSAYSLEIHPGTLYHVKGMKEPDDSVQAAQYGLILSTLREHGYERYEVSSFSRPGYRSWHNLAYWREEDYAAVGLGAAGLEDGHRYKNTSNLAKYLAGERRESDERLSERDMLEEYFLTNLRLKEGFSLKEFERRFGFPFLPKYQEAAQKPLSDGLLEISNGRVRATDLGILLLDRILIALF